MSKENRNSEESRREPAHGADDSHIERQPVPGHTENMPVGPDMQQAPRGGVVEGGAPAADPATKPATPPGTQSERDRRKTPGD